MADLSLREELIASAGALEIETNGLLPASGFVQMIDKSILPHTNAADTEVEDFLPVVVGVNRSNEPAELPQEATAAEVGAVACLNERAIFAWMTGFIRLRFHSYVLKYSAISEVERIVYRDVHGVDITEKKKWTVMFSNRLPGAVIDEFADRLVHSLQSKTEAQ